MNNNEEWVEIIKTSFRVLIDNPRLFNKKREQYLFVENAQGDGAIYKYLLDLPIEYQSKKVNTKVEDIHFYDPEKFCSILGNKPKTDGIKNSVPGQYYTKDKKNNKWVPLGVNIWGAIIDIIECCLTMKDVNRLIYIYGFIDSDTDKHKIRNLPISMTEMHDCETNILRMCLDKYLKELSITSNVEDIISDIFEFTYYQGLLEKLSFKYDNYDSNISRALKRITHYELFKDNYSNCLHMFSSKSDYQKAFLNYINHPPMRINDEDEYADFKLDYRRLLNNSIDVNGVIHRWINESLIEGDKEKLDEIFKISNGHLVLRLMIANMGDYLPPNLVKPYLPQPAKEAKIIFNVLENVDDEVYYSLRSISPLNYYIKFLSLCDEQSSD